MRSESKTINTSFDNHIEMQENIMDMVDEEIFEGDGSIDIYDAEEFIMEIDVTIESLQALKQEIEKRCGAC